MDLSLMSAPELASELGARVRRERLRQNLTQRTLAERSGVSRLTVTRMEEDGSATLTKFLSVLVALRRAGDLDGLLEPPTAETIAQFVGGSQPNASAGQTMSAIDVVYEGETGSWVVARAAQRGAETFVEYTDDHVARNAELAPMRHLVRDRARSFTGRDAEHLPGLLADALPDSWGRLVLRRDMRQHGIEQPTPLQMLTWLGRRTMGALTFRPVEGPTAPDGTLVDLDRVQAEMLRHLSGKDTQDAVADALTRAAGSGAGGARPKITVAYTPDGELVADNGVLPEGSTPWLIKFHSTDDSPYLSAIEATYLQMAAAAGITTCEHRLLGGSSGTSYLAVRRFDRIAAPGRQPRPGPHGYAQPVSWRPTPSTASTSATTTSSA